MRTPALLLTVLLTACAPNPDVEDAGSDVSSFDTPDDAFHPAGPDASSSEPDSSEPDAFDPDAFEVPERCDGLDQDGDARVDESVVDCGDDRACVDAACVCYEGTYDCTPSGRCEVVDVTTRAHCGGCTPCDAASDCSSEGPTPHCVPARISDFTAAFEDSGITCIVRGFDERLVCRGIDADGRVDDGIGWTDMGLDALSVKAWGHTDSRGRAVTLCAHATDNFVYCRGANTTGLLPDGGRRGWQPVLFMASSVRPEEWSIEGGVGLFPTRGTLLVMGGPTATGRARLVDQYVDGIAPATRPFVFFNTEEDPQVRMGTWGASFSSLSIEPWTDEGSSIRVVETGPSNVEQLACYHDYCCAQRRMGMERSVQCWGGPAGSEVRYEDIDLQGIVLPPFHSSSDYYPVRMFPTPTGPRMCIWNNCMALRDIHEAPPSPRGHPLTFDSTVVGAWGMTRPDWRASCDWDGRSFACTGMHTGWPL